MNRLEGYGEFFNEEFRLVVLRYLEEQPNHSLSESMLETLLDADLLFRSRAHLRNQLAYLATDCSAVEIIDRHGAYIATITDIGVNHVKRRSFIDGVKRPAPRRGQ